MLDDGTARESCGAWGHQITELANDPANRSFTVTDEGNHHDRACASRARSSSGWESVMKRTLSVIAVAALLALVLPLGAVSGHQSGNGDHSSQRGGPGKVTICHKPLGAHPVTISISNRAWPAHATTCRGVGDIVHVSRVEFAQEAPVERIGAYLDWHETLLGAR